MFHYIESSEYSSSCWETATLSRPVFLPYTGRLTGLVSRAIPPAQQTILVALESGTIYHLQKP